jgi:hypothetical protein
MESEQTGTLSSKEYKIDAQKLRKSFIYHGLGGTGLILLLRLFEANILIAILLCGAIMVSYFYQFKKGGEPHGLIDTFADSVYYLGFILTLVSLIISMMFFDVNEGALSASYILAQFGAAMITTLLGMVFRIIYKQFDATLESSQLTAREALDETVKGFNIQMRSTNSTLSRLSEVMNKNIKDTESRNEKSIELYESTQKKIIELGEGSLKEFSANSEELLRKSLSELNDFATKSSSLLEKLTQEILETNSNTARANSNEIKQLLESMTKGITEKFIESIKGLSDSAETLGNVFGETNGNATKLNKSFSAVSKSMSKIEALTPNIESVTKSQEVFSKSLENFTSAINEKVKRIMGAENEVGKHLSKLTLEYAEVLNQYKKISEGSGLKHISDEEDKLVEALKSRRESLEDLSKQWASDTENMTRNSNLFTDNLVKTSQFIARELRNPGDPEMEKVG